MNLHHAYSDCLVCATDKGNITWLNFLRTFNGTISFFCMKINAEKYLLVKRDMVNNKKRVIIIQFTTKF